MSLYEQIRAAISKRRKSRRQIVELTELEWAIIQLRRKYKERRKVSYIPMLSKLQYKKARDYQAIEGLDDY